MLQSHHEPRIWFAFVTNSTVKASHNAGGYVLKQLPLSSRFLCHVLAILLLRLPEQSQQLANDSSMSSNDYQNIIFTQGSFKTTTLLQNAEGSTLNWQSLLDFLFINCCPRLEVVNASPLEPPNCFLLAIDLAFNNANMPFKCLMLIYGMLRSIYFLFKASSQTNTFKTNNDL